MANLYTKTGDKGTTALVGGSRVSKASLRVDCYGTVDEANSMLGLAYAKSERPFVRKSVRTIQGRLFALGAELASGEGAADTLHDRIGEGDIVFLERVVDTCTETTGVQTHFVIPGVNEASATLHVARTIVRRAERRMVELASDEDLREDLIRYANRLSDAIYALARLEEELCRHDAFIAEVAVRVRQKLAAYGSSHTSRSIWVQEGSTMNLESMLKVADRAREKATEIKVPMAIAVVDDGGNTVLFQRMDGTILASSDIAVNKAFTAVSLRMSTDKVGELSQPGASLYGLQNTNQGKMVIFGGGFPIEEDGKVVGAIGVSGGSVEEDMIVASYAIGLT